MKTNIICSDTETDHHIDSHVEINFRQQNILKENFEVEPQALNQEEEDRVQAMLE